MNNSIALLIFNMIYGCIGREVFCGEGDGYFSH